MGTGEEYRKAWMWPWPELSPIALHSVSQSSQEDLAEELEVGRNLLNELVGVTLSAEGLLGEAASLGS